MRTPPRGLPAALLVLAALAAPPASAADAGGAAAPAETDWPLHAHGSGEQRHSPLALVDRGNVARLGLAFAAPMETTRGLEASPIEVDGVLYVTGTWSVVRAFDARSGRPLWVHDPQVPRAKGRDACCDAVNRGVAVADGRVFVGALDGRLIALDAKTGAELWQVQTTDPAKPYTITGAPRVVKGRVIIGNGGAEFGVRGYFSAYAAEDGRLLWRFYTVPASKHGPHEQPELARAAETWSEHSLFESGLGGTVWDAMAYDPELDLLYVGTGNASVYDREKRSPGGGDNLFVSSILAVRPETGALVWYYQTTPGDSWDYTATQTLVLADLEIGGRLRKVLLQAPKNGFFYVLDRASGELISAEPYVTVSWASGVDPATGRPVERPEAQWSGHPAIVAPAVVGGHNWQPMSFDPETKLVYLPALELAYNFQPDPAFHYAPGGFNTAENLPALAELVEGLEAGNLLPCSPSRLLAWDPVAQRKVWEVRYDTSISGGTLSTAGGLVFQGDAEGHLNAYDARSGERLWQVRLPTGVMAPPVTYALDGVQYVAVLAGIGGSLGGHFARIHGPNQGWLFAFRLDGDAPVPLATPLPPRQVEAPPLEADAATLARGRALYSRNCLRCHGIGVKSSGLYPDLRFSARAVHERWDDVVLGGVRAGNGMASFADVLSPADSAAIHAYVVERARHEPGALERLVEWLPGKVCIPVSWIVD